MRLDDKAANFVFETCGVFPVEIELVNIQGKESAKTGKVSTKIPPQKLGKTNKQSYFQNRSIFCPSAKPIQGCSASTQHCEFSSYHQRLGVYSECVEEGDAVDETDVSGAATTRCEDLQCNH